LQFPQQPEKWPTNGLRRASVNSFGFGGSNSHAILDDAYHYLQDHNLHGHTSCKENEKSTVNGHSTLLLNCISNVHEEPPTRFKLLVWSASDVEGINRLARVYSQYFQGLSVLPGNETEYLENLAYTLSVRRSPLAWKSFVVSDSISGLLDFGPKLSRPVHSTGKLSIGFVFTGQGAQWPEMGRELLSYPIFYNSFMEAGTHLKLLGCEWSIIGKCIGNCFHDIVLTKSR
jgi:acyl transferase domain-containing protein